MAGRMSSLAPPTTSQMPVFTSFLAINSWLSLNCIICFYYRKGKVLLYYSLLKYISENKSLGFLMHSSCPSFLNLIQLTSPSPERRIFGNWQTGLEHLKSPYISTGIQKNTMRLFAMKKEWGPELERLGK